jgi:putative transposase
LADEEFLLIAFVLMPEHVHLLVNPTRPDADAESISRFLGKLKRPCSARVKADLMASGSRLLERLTVRERPGRSVFRFWQEGPGYDRNLNTAKAALAAIDYIHLNPVRRGLVSEATAWRWSSARWFLSDGKIVDPMLPRLDPLLAELLTGLNARWS